MKDWTLEDIGIHLETLQKAELIKMFEWKGDKFWRIRTFSSNQTLKKDRKPQSIAKDIESWNQLDSNWKPKEVKEVREVSKKERPTAIYNKEEGKIHE